MSLKTELRPSAMDVKGEGSRRRRSLTWAVKYWNDLDPKLGEERPGRDSSGVQWHRSVQTLFGREWGSQRTFVTRE